MLVIPEQPRLLVYDSALDDYGNFLAHHFGLHIIAQPIEAPYLQLDSRLALIQPQTKINPINVDFVTGKNQHRRLYGGGKSQQLCKAVGIKSKIKPSVLDMTAGLGGDAFVLACQGCKLQMRERSAYVGPLLYDGLKRFNTQVGDEAVSMAFNFEDSLKSNAEDIADVVYLDPMYPEHKQKAAVNKSMMAFRQLVGKDEDSDLLLDKAIKAAKYRVVVKRPKKGRYMADQKPDHQLIGKSSRYDIYTLKALLENTL